MDKNVIIAFDTTTHVIAMEKYCNENNLKGKLIPLPNEISAGCGLAWKTESKNKDEVIYNLSNTNLKWKLVTIV